MRIILTGLSLGFLIMDAFASDPVSLRVFEPQRPAPAFDWSGAYVGVDGGYAWGKSKMATQDPIFAPLTAAAGLESIYTEGAFAGIYAGYNRRMGPAVVVVEGDLQFSDIALEYRDGPLFASFATDWFATARLRAGYPVGRLLPYLTAGAALGHSSLKVRDAILPVLNLDQKGTYLGYAVGAGVDAALTHRLIGRIEYQYLDFPDALYDAEPIDIEARVHTLRLGLAYKF